MRVGFALCALVALAAGASAVGQLRESTGGWPACDPNVKQWSGYFDINTTTNKHYFYWAFGARNGLPEKGTPIILWMTGGPGCSGSLALFAENGPCHIKESSSSTSGSNSASSGSGSGTPNLYRNPYSWNEAAIVVYIDQPAGVGYSYADQAGMDSDEHEVAHDMYWFVQALLTAHPTWQKNDFFVFGESYGGHFAPATAHRIWQGNVNHDGLNVPLKGLATGNGLVAPAVQYQYYAELAYTYCQEVKGTPCVSESAYQSMNASIPSCVSFCNSCDSGNTLSCDIGRGVCNGAELDPYMETGLNPYDIRIPCQFGNLCYNFDAVTSFLNQKDVQQALGVASENIQWTSCNFNVNGAFGADWLRRFDTKVPDLLANNIRVLVYAGDMDFICNWLGNKAWTLALDWTGKSAFNAAPDVEWKIDNKTAAWARSVSGHNTPIQFTFLRVHDAGHMVPMDQPHTALEMVKSFLGNKKFGN